MNQAKEHSHHVSIGGLYIHMCFDERLPPETWKKKRGGEGDSSRLKNHYLGESII